MPFSRIRLIPISAALSATAAQLTTGAPSTTKPRSRASSRPGSTPAGTMTSAPFSTSGRAHSMNAARSRANAA
jgi:hypothetical protein